MGWTVWIFRCEDRGWRKVPQAWYDRFLDGEDTVADPEGSLVQFAQVAVELEDREPVQLGNIWYVVHGVGPGGRLDTAREREAAQSALDLAFSPLFPKRTSEASQGGSVVHAEKRFAERRHGHLAKWNPSPSQEEALFDKLRALDVPC